MGKFEEIITDLIFNEKKSVRQVKREFEEDLEKIKNEIEGLYNLINLN